MKSRYAGNGAQSTSTSKAIIEWPKGLLGQPIIRPLGKSFEESEAVRKFLEDRLAVPQPGRRDGKSAT